MDSKTEAGHPRHQPRVEDDALVRGAGHFIADRHEPNLAYAAFVRSPVPTRGHFGGSETTTSVSPVPDVARSSAERTSAHARPPSYQS